MPEIETLTANTGLTGAEPAVEPEALPGEGGESTTPEVDPNAEPAITGETGAEPGTGEAAAEEPRVKLSEHTALRKRAQEAEDKAAVAQAELDAIRAQQRQPKRIEAEPDLVNYESVDAYNRDVKEWNKQIAREEINREKVDDDFRSRAQKAAVKIPDYHQVTSTTTIPITMRVAEAIKLSEIGPDVFYYLAKNPGEAYRLAAMNDTLAVVEIGKLEAKLSQTVAPAKPKTSQAPPPVVPLAGGKTSVDTEWDAEKHTTAENIAHWNAENSRR